MKNDKIPLFNLQCDSCKNIFTIARQHTELPYEELVDIDGTINLDNITNITFRCPHCHKPVVIMTSNDDVVYSVSSLTFDKSVRDCKPNHILFKSYEEAVEEITSRAEDFTSNAHRLINKTSEDEGRKIILADAVTTLIVFISWIEIIPKSFFAKNKMPFITMN
jgi:hypothetical protein